MKKSEYYQNLYPLEDLLPELTYRESVMIAKEDDYTSENNSIADKESEKINIEDASYFIMLGYSLAKERIDNVLTPIQNETIPKIPDPKEIWDEYSEYIGEHIYDLKDVAGSTIMKERNFIQAINKLKSC